MCVFSLFFHVCVHVRTCMRVHMHACVCERVFVCVHMYVHVRERERVCVCVCVEWFTNECHNILSEGHIYPELTSWMTLPFFLQAVLLMQEMEPVSGPRPPDNMALEVKDVTMTWGSNRDDSPESSGV